MPSAYELGRLVVHPRKPEWGPGRILLIDGTKVTVYFRDLPGRHPEDAVKTIDTRVVGLDTATSQSDPLLDNLPPYANGKFHQSPRRRVTLNEGIEKFQSHFPLFFEDPAYIGDLQNGERAYKWATHELYVQHLGDSGLRDLLAARDLAEVRRRAGAVEGRMNLLSIYEKAAFRDGLRDDVAAARYFEALDALLSSPQIDRHLFEIYLDSVASLPSHEGKTSPAKWTVATFLPFFAQPDRFMFMKPEVTQDCAARLTFDLHYTPELNWDTYAKLVEMSEYLLAALRQYGARDFIDVQSFIWLIGAAWE